jgi:hypothetical protein
MGKNIKKTGAVAQKTEYAVYISCLYTGNVHNAAQYAAYITPTTHFT